MWQTFVNSIAFIAFLRWHVHAVAEVEPVARINERLTTDAAFLAHWSDLIAQQADQAAQSYITDDSESYLQELSACGRRARIDESAVHIDTLMPSHISIYADLGHLSTYCTHNLTLLKDGHLDSCTHQATTAHLPTIDKFLRFYNPNLTVIEEDKRPTDNFTTHVARIAEKIKQDVKDYEKKWKLVVMLPNIQDGQATETDQFAIEVLSAVSAINTTLPKRTLVVVLRNTGKGIWKDAANAHVACRVLLDRWKTYVSVDNDAVWDQVELIAQKNYENSEFSVQILPLFSDSALAMLHNASDLSALGYDCSHWSERGLSLLHRHIWNAVLTADKDREKHFRPIFEPLRCPDPNCPFFRTARNSDICPYNPIKEVDDSMGPLLIAVASLTLCLLLCTLIVSLICCRRRPKHNKAFGSNLSSIRFIDEDD